MMHNVLRNCRFFDLCQSRNGMAKFKKKNNRNQIEQSMLEITSCAIGVCDRLVIEISNDVANIFQLFFY